MKHTPKFYDGDYEIESVITNLTFDFGINLGDVRSKSKKPSAKELDTSMFSAISNCRKLGLTEDEIRNLLVSNLGAYGYDHITFPIDRWMEEK